MLQKDTNIQKIAELAGVSKTTVSRVINNRPDVNPETRKKVEEIIEDLGYYPNAIARAFSRQKSMSIGLVFPNDESRPFSNPYYAELMRGILGEAREKHYRVILSYLQNGDCFLLARQKIVDGLLVLTPGSDHKAKLAQLLELGIPLVSTSRVPGLKNLHYVAVDEFGASCEIIRYLISLGHRRIGFISGPKTLFSSGSRLRGYRAALKKAGIPCDPGLVAFGDTSAESGERVMGQFLDGGKQMTAVFAGSDMMAIGAKHAIEARGMRVPEDISLVSSDATDMADYLETPLTTLEQPTFQRGSQAARMLIDMIEGRPVPDSVTLPMGIAVRKTTKAVSPAP